jgi:hypothetical protein
MNGYPDFFNTAGDAILTVLDEGVIDPSSRTLLGAIYRDLAKAAALTTQQPPALDAAQDDDRAFFYRWCDHVGSIYHVQEPARDAPRACLAHHAFRALEQARAVWLDELDAMSSRELRPVPGIGAKGEASVRAALDAYYWRGDEAASRELWQQIDRGLRRSLEYATACRDRGQEARIVAGLELAERVVAQRGAPIADPSVVQMVA